MTMLHATCWKQNLPKVKGRIAFDAPLAGLTWFRVGGAAEVLFRPADADDLAGFLAALPESIPVTIIGVGSNLLVRDGGIKGVVIRLGASFGKIELGNGTITAGAAALDLTVAMTAADAGIKGLEFLSGVPGTIGGALRMNAGAFGGEMKDVVISTTALTRNGKRVELSLADLDFGYRHCGAPPDLIFLSATMRAEPGDKSEIMAVMDRIRQAREASQPTRTRTGGSTFANPDGAKAWELIDRAGCRGLKMGGAMVSEKHCNFLINTGDASAADIEDLGDEVRRRVLETSGISLRWEIRRIGEREPS